MFEERRGGRKRFSLFHKQDEPQWYPNGGKLCSVQPLPGLGVGRTFSLLCGDRGLEAGLSGGDESTSTGSSSFILMSGVEGSDMSRAALLCGETSDGLRGQ